LKRGTKVVVAQVSFADGKVWRLSSAEAQRCTSGGSATE
jgi:hypothetical protein